MAGGIEIEAHAVPLPAVRAVVGGADDARLGVAVVERRGVNRLERAGSQRALAAAGDQDRVTWRRPCP
jgi:hypothetical protein